MSRARVAPARNTSTATANWRDMRAASRILRILGAWGCAAAWTVANATAVPAIADPALNPWALPLMMCADRPGGYDVDIDMGFVNTDYACHIDPAQGIQFDTKTRQPSEQDAARWVLDAINRCQHIRHFRLQTGVSRDSRAELQALLPTLPVADIRIGRQQGTWSPPETHTKVFQLADVAAGRYVTVHGSLNLQTVGMSCKANNAVRFVEAAPGALHGYFKQLADAVAVNSAEGLFGGAGTVDSSGVMPEVAIGDYRVAFYAGRAQGFVGARVNDDALPWPMYLNPPVAVRPSPSIVHWYDSVLVETARQLAQGRHVRLDVLMFEIGADSAFVNHLWRFVQEGFVGGLSADGDAMDKASVPILGRLDVRFLWQFQSHPKPSGRTTVNLENVPVIETPGPQGGYHLQTGRIWPQRDAMGRVVAPTTPYDMHNKVVLMSVPKHSQENRIFVASSNLDAPGVGSGRLWQVGTIVRSIQPQLEEAGAPSRPASLFQAYQLYFDRLWRNRQGTATPGQVSFYEALTPLHRAGRVNWIETARPSAATGADMIPGIDAFFFPVPTEAP